VAYDLTGKVKLIQAVQTFDSGFTKREMVVIVQDGKYPQEINLEFVQDKVGLLDNLQVGQEVTVTFDIRGREYNGRYFNNLQGWKIVTPGNETASSSEGHSSAPPGIAPPDFDDSDIPF
jgi:single-strand DNA-binding protein